MPMNCTEESDVTNTASTNQSQLLASGDDAFNIGNTISLATRIFNGIIIAILFTFGIATNIILLYVLRRRRGILLRNTSVILINLIISDLTSCLVVVPHDFAFSALQINYPQAKEMFKASFVLKTVMIFLNCNLTIVLSIERYNTATYVGKRRKNHLSTSLIVCLAAIWLATLVEAIITYCSFKESNPLPWKLSGLATSTRSRCPPAGTIIAAVLVLVAIITTLFSLCRMQSFLQAINQDAVKEPLSSDFSKRLRRMHKRINLASLASLITLATSYLPLIIAHLVWLSLGRQSTDFNAIAQVFCSMAHTINPLIAVALSRRMQSAVLKVFKSLCQSRTPQQGNHFSSTMHKKVSFRTAREVGRIVKHNVQNSQCDSPIPSSHRKSTSITDEKGFLREIGRCREFSFKEAGSRVVTLKKALTNQYSTPAGKPLHIHTDVKRT